MHPSTNRLNPIRLLTFVFLFGLFAATATAQEVEATVEAEVEAGDPAPADVGGFSIGLSLPSLSEHYSLKLADSVEAVVLDHGPSSLAVTDANGSASKQLADIEKLLALPVEALIVVPVDDQAILPALRKANEQGVVVVAIGNIPNATVLTTIAANSDYANGRASADLLVDATGGKGKIATFGFPGTLARIDQRERGFEDAIAGTKFEIVAHEEESDPAKVQELVAGLLATHPDLTGIWVASGSQLLGAADALRAADNEAVALTGVDAEWEVIERIRRGWISGSAAQFPAQQGKLAAEALFLHFAGEKVPPTYEVEVGTVTVDNADFMEERIWAE